MKTMSNSLLVAALAAVAVGCGRENGAPATQERTWPVMGTYASIVVHDPGTDAALTIARDAVEEVTVV